MAKYALVMGLTDYDDFNQLTRPAADARTVAQILQTGGYRITSVLGAADYDKIVAQLKTFLQQTAHKNEALIYITGHSFLVWDKITEEQAGYIATSNCRVRRENDSIVEQSHGIPFINFNKLIAKADLSNLVLLLDTCHSGGLIEQGLFQQSFRTFGQKTDYFFITAARTAEAAWAKSGAPHSVFTTAVLSGLAAENAPEGGVITGDDLSAHIARQLQHEKQEPMRLGQGRSIEILRYGAVVTDGQVSDENPYQGLKAFTGETKRFFHGRAQKVSEIGDRLDWCNFVPVVGPSGIGKSSVVRAGLLPQLESFGWQVLIMKPDDEPMTRLRLAVKDWLEQQNVSRREQQRLTQIFDHPTNGLSAWAEALPGNESLLLLVDQFEEVFTLRKEMGLEPMGQRLPDEQTKFIHQILAVSNLSESRLKVVTTMRSDFIDPWLATGQPPSVVQQQTVYLGPLQNQDLTDAIVKPAQTQGYDFGAGLQQLILKDVEAEPNSLPLLEFALTELWERRDRERRLLTANAYDDMGGLQGALNKRAEDEYAKLSDVEKKWIRQICLALVRIGRDEKDTRRRRLKTDLLALGTNEVDIETVQYVIDGFVAGRLLVTDGDETSGYVDIAHEALMAGWQRFADWRQENRDQRRLIQRLEDAHEEWVAKNKNDKYLLQGGLLEEWRDLDAQLVKELIPQGDLRSFFAQSDVQEQENAAKLKQALAESELKDASRKIRDKLINLPQYTVEATIEAIDAVGYSLEKFRGDVKHSAQDALNRSWNKIHERLKLQGHSGGVRAVAFSPDGDRIVSGSSDNTLRLWDREGSPIGEPLQGHSDWVWAVAFSPDGDRIVSGSSDNTLRLWRGGGWRDWLRSCCTQLLKHSDLVQQKNGSSQRACELCQQSWTRRERAEFLVAQGRYLAYQGHIEEAIAKFEAALALHSRVLTAEPTIYAQQLAAQTVMAKGKTLAKNDKPDDALAQFERAIILDPERKFDPQLLTQQLQALGLITRSRSQLMNYHHLNDVEAFQQLIPEQISALERALSLDSSLKIDPSKQVYKLATSGIEHYAQQFAKQGDLKGSFALLEELQTHLPEYAISTAQLADAAGEGCRALVKQGKLEPAFKRLDYVLSHVPEREIPARVWNSIAWSGCTLGYGQHPEVQKAGELAVELDTKQTAPYRDTRGVCRALGGNVSGAIEDFQAYVDWIAADRKRSIDKHKMQQQRLEWIMALRANENPFTPELLEAIKDQ